MMRSIGEHITWNGKSGVLGGTVRSIKATYEYVVDIDGSPKQVIVTEYETIKHQ